MHTSLLFKCCFHVTKQEQAMCQNGCVGSQKTKQQNIDNKIIMLNILLHAISRKHAGKALQLTFQGLFRLLILKHL
ncbi:hypothetical protein DBY68_013085 [Pseudocitrobacter sp. RIT415]|nr:hypothetical protein DBY68_013085 [Pseudocitrobacter sp. RIT 415]